MIARLWRRRPWALAAFALSLALALFFAARTILFVVYWSDPAHRDAQIAGWMTPRYVAHSWQVPPGVIAEALALEQNGTGRRMTLAQLAQDRGLTLDALIADIAHAIEAHRASQ